MSSLIARAASTFVIAALALPVLGSAPASALSAEAPQSEHRALDQIDQIGSGDSDDSGETRYLVRFTERTDVRDQAAALRADGIGVARTFDDAVNAAVVTATPDEVADLAASPAVTAIAVDAPVSVSVSWGLDRTDQRELPLSGSFTAPGDGAGVTAYVVDTGVRADHAELRGRVATGWTAVQDGRGTGDCNGHGTHVAGTVAGTGYGVAKRASIVPVRVLGCDGTGRMSDVVAGLDWVALQHQAGEPAVVNLSLGGGANTIVDAALQGVIDDGVTAVVAAGNATTDACATSPARVSDALTVGATDSSDRVAAFSNYGQCLDVFAPGTQIQSAWYTSETASATLQGTSMAAPHVAGVAAVLLGIDPTLSPAQVASRVNTDATIGVLSSLPAGSPDRLLYLASALAPVKSEPVPAPVAEEPMVTQPPAPVAQQPVTEPPATEEPVTEPPATEEPVADEPVAEEPVAQKPVTEQPAAKAPTRARNVKARARARAAVITWVRGDARGSELTGQTVLVYRNGDRVRTIRVGASATRARIARLQPGGGYTFRVIERNEIGSSRPSLRSNRIMVRR